jgi:putative transposase
MAFQPFDPRTETRVHRERLPHWRQWGATYFVTARLADSIPREVAEAWREERDAWLRGIGLEAQEGFSRLDETIREDYHRRFTQRFHDLIDECRGECLLARPECAKLLADRILAGHGGDYRLDAWCLMPNHFHAVVDPAEGRTLGKVLQSWKGGSAREINAALGRKGPLWQRESFDHIVRSEEQLDHFRRYIFENPIKAGLKSGYVLGKGSVIIESL